jgi:membrane protein insertase Oxa1/YidC/SpoIIIJ
VVEHIFYMILAMIFAHLGSILPKKVQDAAKKHQRAAIFFILAVVVILMGIPWGRPLFPGL